MHRATLEGKENEPQIPWVTGHEKKRKKLHLSSLRADMMVCHMKKQVN